jgi:hypothetical protein
MFCGDSHLRQFREHAGVAILSLTYFPGATMKGLASPRGAVGHRHAILTLVTIPTPKTLFLMFGNVDLDVTWFRKSILEGGIDEEDFFRQRCDALTTFVEECRRVAGGTVDRVCVILPQLPTVADPHFVGTTALCHRGDASPLAGLAAGRGAGVSRYGRATPAGARPAARSPARARRLRSEEALRQERRVGVAVRLAGGRAGSGER